MKVIIADDEPVIIRGLKVLVDWKARDFEIIAEASDGMELWSLVQKYQPEIVVSDIAMPNMTGLDFMKKLNQSELKTKVIFISGYQKFSYAQEAIGLGAVDYLLKPVQKEGLEEALEKARNSFSDARKLDLFTPDKNELQQLFQKLNEKNEFAEEDLYASFEKTGIEYKGKVFCGICIYFTEKFRREMEGQMYEKFELLKFSAFNKIANYFKERRNGFVVKRENDCLNLLCVLAPEEKAFYLQEMIVPMKEQIEQELRVHLQIGVSEFSDNPLELAYVYKSAKFAYEMKYFLQKEVICSGQIHRQFLYSFEDYQKAYENVVNAILNRENCEEAFEKCFLLIGNLHYGNRYAVINRVILFAGDLFHSLREYNMLEEKDWQKQELYMEQVRCQSSLQELHDVFMDHYRKMMEQLGESEKEWDNPVIAEVQKYICEHYAENITMGDMAKIACVNAYYFSALFKKTTGQNFKTYLTDVRMKAAQKLVITTNMKTYEIAEHVGYNNVRQFTGKFKEYYGSSPSEYKKKLMEK